MERELLKCDSCAAEFSVHDMEQKKTDESDENSTQFGMLMGLCPNCGAEIPLSLSQIRELLEEEANS